MLFLQNLIASGNNTKTTDMQTTKQDAQSKETTDKSPGMNVSNIVGTDKHIYSLKELISGDFEMPASDKDFKLNHE